MCNRSGYYKLHRDIAKLDVFVGSLGYEKRCTALIASKSVEAEVIVIIAHQQNRLFSYTENENFYKSSSARIIEDLDQLGSIIVGVLALKPRKARIGIDVSSMNRVMIAQVLSCIAAVESDLLELVIFYLPATFEEPEKEFPKIEMIGPVTPEFSGFDSDPRFPVGLIAGIGHEYGLAVGLVNQIEPKLALCFRAIGTDKRYEQSVRHANFDFDFGGFNIDVAEYDVSDPASALRIIESVVYGMSSSFRVIMVPLGPKLFAAMSSVVALKYFGRVAVWRVSSGLAVKDAFAMGDYAALFIEVDQFVGSLERKRLRSLYRYS